MPFDETQLRANTGLMSTTLSQAASPASRRALALSWAPLALVLLCAVDYGVAFVLPYFAIGLDRHPLADVAIGYHDPKDLWPYNVPGWGYAAGWLGLLTLSCGWLVTALAIGWAAFRRRGLLDSAAVVLGLALLVGVFLPFGLALQSWWLD